MKDIYVERARENYLLLNQTIDLLQELVANDAIMPILNNMQKAEAETLIKEFNRNQLPKRETDK